MFDLFRSRAKAVRILLGAMLAVVALSMLVYLIPGAGAPVGDRNNQIVAEIGKDSLTVQEVELQIRRVLQNRQLPPEMVQVYIPQLIDQAIADRAMAYQAQQLGFRITDRDLADTIRSLPVGGLPPDQYRQNVEQQFGMTVATFESNLRLQIYEEALQRIAVEGIIVTPTEVEAIYRRHNDKVKLEYIAFDPSKLSAEAKPGADELKAYFERTKGLFTVPESRGIQLIIADQGKVAASIPIADSQVQAYYNSHQEQYRTPERVHARHILLSTAGKSDPDKAKIKAKADDLLKQIKSGGDFAKLAEKNSEDPGSATKGGDLGWVVRGQTVKNFEDAAFSLKPKEISNLITTEYGFHIIEVLEKDTARLRTVGEVQPEIITTLRNQTVYDRMQSVMDQAHTELVKSPQSAQAIAAKLNLQFFNVDKFKPGDVLPGLGTDAQIGSTLNSMKKGEVSQVLQAGNNLGVAVVSNIIGPHPPEFAEVEAQVRQRYAAEKGSEIAANKAKKAADLAKANGGDLKAAAKSVGLEVKTSDFFSRDGAAEGIGSGVYLADAFDKPVGSVIGPVNVGPQTVVLKVLERQPADMAKLAQERDGIVTQAKAQKMGERQTLLQDSVVTHLIQQGKIKKNQDVINRLMARYRG